MKKKELLKELKKLIDTKKERVKKLWKNNLKTIKSSGKEGKTKS